MTPQRLTNLLGMVMAVAGAENVSSMLGSSMRNRFDDNEKKKCILPECNEQRNGNGLACSSEHYKEYIMRKKGKQV